MISDEHMLNALRAKLELPGVDVLKLSEAVKGYDLPPNVTVGEVASFIISQWISGQ